MNWKELLEAEIQSTYAVTERLIALVADDGLQWRPATGHNSITTGQTAKTHHHVLRHLFPGLRHGRLGNA